MNSCIPIVVLPTLSVPNLSVDGIVMLPNKELFVIITVVALTPDLIAGEFGVANLRL